MKTKLITLSVLALSVQGSQAAGFKCEAYCVKADRMSGSLYVSDEPVSYTAGTSKSEVFKTLERKCKRMGLSRPADEIAWDGYETSSRHGGVNYPRAHSRSYRFDDYRTMSRSGSLTKDFENQSISYSGSYQAYWVDRYGNTVGWSNGNYSGSWTYWIRYSTPDSACVLDQAIEDGEIPYDGDIPVLG